MSLKLPTWQLGEPPDDGEVYVAQYDVHWECEPCDEIGECVAMVRWDYSRERWMDAEADTVICDPLSDKIVFHSWSEMPPQPQEVPA